MKASSLLCAVLLLAAPAAAEDYSQVFGPLHLVGKHAQMRGPFFLQSFFFPRDAMLTGLSVELLDARRRPAADRSPVCHVTFMALPDPRIPNKRAPISEGFGFQLPKGYGYPVKRDGIYLATAMLKSDSERTDAEYYFRFTFRLAEPGRPVEPLKQVVVGIQAADAGQPSLDRPYEWAVPSGKHEYAVVKQAPASGLVFQILPHVHRFARRVALQDAASGRVLWESAVSSTTLAGAVEAPVFGGQRAVELVRGRSYRWSVSYDNPSSREVSAMGTFFVLYAPKD